MANLLTPVWVELPDHPNYTNKARRVDIANDTVFQDDPFNQELTMVLLVRTYDDINYTTELTEMQHRYTLKATHDPNAEPRKLISDGSTVYKYQTEVGTSRIWLSPGNYGVTGGDFVRDADGNLVENPEFSDTHLTFSEYKYFANLKNVELSINDIKANIINDLNAVGRFNDLPPNF